MNLLRDNFLGEISRTRIAKTGYFLLFTKDRTLIIHRDRSRIMGLAAPPGTNKMLDKALNGFEGGERSQFQGATCPVLFQAPADHRLDPRGELSAG